MNSLTAIILTFNEEKHIERCITSLNQVVDKVFVVDSFSTDRTCEIARELGAEIYQNAFTNYANQFNWALDNCEIKTVWTMRMDCDEYLTEELIDEINEKLQIVTGDVGGYIIKRRVLFLNKWIKYGGFYPHRLLRIWRTGTGKIEDRWMDEHVVLEPEDRPLETFTYDMVDHNLNDLSWWIEKHNGYATREMRDLLAIQTKSTSEQNVKSSIRGEQYSRKRWIKENVYTKMPLFARPFFYFTYRYFVLFGFLDGKPGLIWHFLQAFWYRFLVDAKLYEYSRKYEDSQKNA